MPAFKAPSMPQHLPRLVEGLDCLSLQFSGSAIQSRMRLRDPDGLDLEYTRLMMGFLAFMPQPKRIALLGLGGGSLVKFCHRHLPRAGVTAVEISPEVIALRERFQVPPDDDRLQVIESDGALFVAETTHRFDVLLVDAFDADGMPGSFGTPSFYGDAWDVLGADGVMVVNLHAGHPQQPIYLDRIRGAFGDPEVLAVDDADRSNSVVFAVKGAARERWHGAACARRPAGLSALGWTVLSSSFGRLARALATA